MDHAVTWQTAQPLWSLSLDDSGSSMRRFHAPALLRFVGDDFMAQLVRTLDKEPSALAGYVAQPESWREQRAGWRNEAELDDEQPLKLFQPSHFRFYLVTASLVCRVPGLPERRVDAAARERTNFVLRRLVPKAGAVFNPSNDATYFEYGWQGDAQAGQWVPVTPEISAEEERLPLAPSHFDFEGQARRLLAGVVPVARRDIYEAAAGRIQPPAKAATAIADRLFSPAAAEAFQRIRTGLSALGNPLNPPYRSDSAEADLRGTAKVAFAYLLLDIVDYLQTHLPSVWVALVGGSASGLSPHASDLYERFDSTMDGLSKTYREALLAVADQRTPLEESAVDEAFVNAQILGAPRDRLQLATIASKLNQGDTLYEKLVAALGDPRLRALESDVLQLFRGLGEIQDDEPAQDALLMALLALADFLRVELTDVWNALSAGSVSGLPAALANVYSAIASEAVGPANLRILLLNADEHRLDILSGHVTPSLGVVDQGLTAANIASLSAWAAELATVVAGAMASLPLPTRMAASAALAESPPAPPEPGWYHIRCLYERPRCSPHHAPLLSEPSQPFMLASFFDSDAPIRPIRIQMPDIDLASLRRSPRGVSFALSKQLREQIDRVRNAGLDGLVDKNLGQPPAFDFGVICSLSIPIVTICGMMVLMIVVSILDLFLRWIPYFIVCLPRFGRR